MEINTQFYTTAQEDIPNTYGVKRFVKTYKSMLNDGDLPFNEPFDVSISPYAMAATADGFSNYDNDIVNKCWCFPNIDDLDTERNNPENVKRELLYDDEQTFYPFLIQWGSGSSTAPGFGYANYATRNAYEQTVIDYSANTKTNNYIATDYKYNRLVFLVQVYISLYGRENTSLTANNLHKGGWHNLADVTDEQFNNIIDGQQDINGVRFIPYYALSENSPETHMSVKSMQFKPLCTFKALDKSIYGMNAAYTDDYIDYMINSYAGIGDYLYADGYTTTSLGHIARSTNRFAAKYKTSNGWVPYESIVTWCDSNFNATTIYDKFGTFSQYWNKTVIGVNNYQYIAFRQYLNVTMLDTKEKIIDYLCTQCAYLGCYFSIKSPQDNFALNSTNPDCYLGCIESDGMTHGRYVKGTDIASEPYGDDVEDIRTAVGWTPPVPEGAFKDATNLVKVRIPQSCSTIGKHAFEGTQLTKVTIASDCTYYNTSFPDGCVVNFYPD